MSKPFAVNATAGPPEGLEPYQDVARILIYEAAQQSSPQQAVSLFISTATSFLVAGMGNTPERAADILRAFADQIGAAHERAGMTEQ